MAKYIDREALIEWLKRIPLIDLSDGRGLCRVIMEDDFKKAMKKMPKGIIADVEPVQEWIPVTERLPDLIPCNVGTAYSEAVIAWTSGRKAMIAVWDGIDWIAPFDYWEAWGEEITHWMPLPEPPKGE